MSELVLLFHSKKWYYDTNATGLPCKTGIVLKDAIF